MFFQEYKKFIILFLLAFGIALVLFGPSLSGKFTLDDHSVIEKGTRLMGTRSLFEVWVSPWHPGGQWAGNYRPLTSVSFIVNDFFSGKPVGFRLVNVLLYALNVIFLFYLVQRLSTEKAAYLAAVVFLFLPIHSEVVMSVVGRVYLLGTLFSIVSIYHFLNKRYWISSGYLLLALLSGDAFISLILIVLALSLIEYRSFGKVFRLGAIYAAGLPVYFIFRYLALGKYAFGGFGFIDPIIGPLAFVSVKERIFTALSHLYLYLRKTFYPVDLSPDYSFNQIPIVANLFGSWRALIGLAFILLLAYVFYRSKRKDVKVGIILFLVPYLVMSNIFFITTGTMAERWWYFPSIGLVILVAAAVESLKFKVKNYNFKFKIFNLSFSLSNFHFLLLILLVWYSFITFSQNKVWLNDQNLFIYAAEKSPNSAWARTNVAEGFFLSGNTEKAKEEIDTALKISKQYPSALYVLSQIYWKEGRFGEAEEVLLKAIKVDTYDRNKRSFYRSLALINLDTGNNKQALLYMQEAVKWPATGDLEKTIRIDNLLLQKTEEYSNREINSYTQEETEGLVNLIKILRGF